MATVDPGRQPKLEARHGKSDQSSQRKERKQAERQGSGALQHGTVNRSRIRGGSEINTKNELKNRSDRTQGKGGGLRCGTYFFTESSKITID
jgi:hypothetical protein